MNPRYAAWLATNPPTLTSTDFIIWMNARWGEWRALRGVSAWAALTPAQHDDFDRWLGVPDEDEIYGIMCSLGAPQAGRRMQGVA